MLCPTPLRPISGCRKDPEAPEAKRRPEKQGFMRGRHMQDGTGRETRKRGRKGPEGCGSIRQVTELACDCRGVLQGRPALAWMGWEARTPGLFLAVPKSRTTAWWEVLLAASPQTRPFAVQTYEATCNGTATALHAPASRGSLVQCVFLPASCPSRNVTRNTPCPKAVVERRHCPGRQGQRGQHVRGGWARGRAAHTQTEKPGRVAASTTAGRRSGHDFCV